MPDYSKSKIYKIVPTCEYDEGDEYFGSTIRPLSERMNNHRGSFKSEKGKCNSKILFEKYGVENCKIELVEEYPCDNREQLEKKEGEYIRANKCINKYIAGRTNGNIREYQKIYHKQYHLENLEKLREKKKQYYLDNKEYIKEKSNQYNLNRKSCV